MFRSPEMDMGTCLSGACHSYMPPQLKTNKQNNMINPIPWDLESQPMVPKMVKMAEDVL